MWFDSHCHLQLCEQAEAARLVETARSAGVDRMVAIGIDVETTGAARELALEHGLWFSSGLHPNQADEWNDARDAIEEMLTDPLCVAVGETGLDFYRTGAPPEIQERAFSAHIELAKAHDKALVIHTRESVEAALELLERVGPPPRLVFHCWSGTPDDLNRALATGAFVSFAGNVSFASAGPLREAAKLVPADRLLVETDSPYLSPVPHRGKPNEPANVVHVGEAVAAARDEPLEEVASTTAANASVLFSV